MVESIRCTECGVQPCPDCMKKRAELIICQNCKHHTNKPSKCEFFGFVNRKNDASLCDKFEKK
jgi:hypothetical protein